MDLDGRYLVVFILVLLSAFFSASETAFSTVNLIRLKNAKEEGRKGAKTALYIADHFENTLSTVLIGNNIVNIATSSLATIIFIDILNDRTGPLVATIVTTIIVLLFGEILPKTYAKAHSFEFALRFGVILWVFYRLFYPLSFILTRFTRFMHRVLRSDEDVSMPSVTEDELEVIINTMEEEGVLEEEERVMMRNVLDLGTTSVYDIMTPRVDMVGIYLDDDIEYIKEVFFKEKFSRIPVYKETKDNVVGILYERDFFSALLRAKDPNDVKIEKIMRKPLFVTKSMHVDDLMATLQRNKQHMAIVSDEYGGTAGLVTMEDCLEELVGEIYDEHDEEELLIRKIDENHYEVNASIGLEDLFEELHLGQSPETQYHNLGGWLYQQLEEIPEIGDEYVYRSRVKVENGASVYDDDEYVELTLTFTVKELQERRMKTILLTIDRQQPENGKRRIRDRSQTEDLPLEPTASGS